MAKCKDGSFRSYVMKDLDEVNLLAEEIDTHTRKRELPEHLQKELYSRIESLEEILLAINGHDCWNEGFS